MRYLIATTLCALLASPVCVWAQAKTDEPPKKEKAKAAAGVEAPPKECQSSDLEIVGKNQGTERADFRFTMGDALTIKASGACAGKIRQELAKAPGSKALSLHLDGVRMVNLPLSLSQAANGKELLLNFHLARDSNSDDNRKAWDTLLRNQEGSLMTLSVALAIGNEPAFPVQSAEDFQFYVARAAIIWLTLGIGLVIFLVAYYLLVNHPTVLRDENGAYSLGKSQMAFWGLLVVLTFAGVWLVTQTMERIPPQVLILLGISAATGLGAIVIGENKKASQKAELENEQQKLEKEKAAAAFPQASQDRLAEVKSAREKMSEYGKSAKSRFFRDICDDGNGMSFHRLQVVIWTVILGVVFIWSVAQVMSMPEFPETLLTLMGISSGMYLGFKIPEKIPGSKV